MRKDKLNKLIKTDPLEKFILLVVNSVLKVNVFDFQSACDAPKEVLFSGGTSDHPSVVA